MRSCENCKFGMDFRDVAEEGQPTVRYGYCRRFPPQVLAPHSSADTLIRGDSWCGEHRFVALWRLIRWLWF